MVYKIGTNGNDELYGTAGDDILKGAGGNDLLYGGSGDDDMLGGAGNDTYYVSEAGDDVIEGVNAGFDTVYTTVDGYTLTANVEALGMPDIAGAMTAFGNNLNNLIAGNASANSLYGWGGNDIINGGAGADDMFGGVGDDMYFVDNVNDDVVETEDAGHDTVYATTSYSILTRDHVEDITLFGSAGASNAEGNDGDNTLFGNASANTLTGNGGHDVLNGGDSADILLGGAGDDTLLGGSGGDVLTGGSGRDIMSGGAGLDFFVFNDTADTGLIQGTADVITDFNIAEGDRIQLANVDADVFAFGNQAFTFIGQAAFSGTPGEINYYHSGGNTYIQLQTGNSADVEGVICLEGIQNPEASWFIL